MAIVRSYGSVQSLAPSPLPRWTPSGGLTLYGDYRSYAELYRTQPNVRTCVDFLARNIAQLGLRVYRRLSDTDRERLNDHPLAQLIRRPNPFMSRYRLFETLMQDLGVYYNAFWLKIRVPGQLGVLRLPPAEISVAGGLVPSAYIWTVDGRELTYAPSEIVHFSGYDPENPLTGLSPLETLRRILAEEAAASEYREYFYANNARIDGVITRPKDAPPWDDALRQRFREQWQEAHAGGPNTGKTAILEDGMDWKPGSHTAKDSEFVPGRKLSREECAAAYQIPQPMVGILDHASFSNIREQHKNLYQDTLGPWCVLIEEEFERQLLPEFPDQDRVYTEFNIAEKLKGSFEEQAASIRSLVGRPVMTLNEGRAILNLPSQDEEDADRVARPLNVSAGGDENPDPAGPAPTPRRRLPPADEDEDEDAEATTWQGTIRAFWARQATRIAKDPAPVQAARFDHARWNRELADDLAPFYADPQDARDVAEAINATTYMLLAGGQAAFGAARDLPAPRIAPDDPPQVTVEDLADLRAEIASLHARLDAQPVPTINVTSPPVTVAITAPAAPPTGTRVVTFQRNEAGELTAAAIQEAAP
jgi:HK97 family phage portal protein